MKTKLLNLISLFAMLTSCNAQDDIRQMSASEFRDALKSDAAAALLDVRSAKEYSDGHLPSAMNIDVLEEEAFVNKAKSLEKSKTWYIYCRSGRRSMRAARLMKDLGYSVVNMEGGITAWEKAQLPVTKAADCPPDGNKTVAGDCEKASDTFTTRNGERLQLSSDISVEAVAAYNTSADKLAFHPKGRDNGYVLNIDGMRIYIAGDTEPVSDMEALGTLDIAFLPCNLPYTMSLAQCAEAAKTVKPAVLFPYHYGETDVEKLAGMLQGSGIDVRIRPYK